MKNDGGQAYPIQGNESAGSLYAEKGMSLRDFFAAKALPQVAQTYAECDPKHAARVAEICYHYADAMLAERSKDQPRAQMP